jgi:hypothetical protein
MTALTMNEVVTVLAPMNLPERAAWLEQRQDFPLLEMLGFNGHDLQEAAADGFRGRLKGFEMFVASAMAKASSEEFAVLYRDLGDILELGNGGKLASWEEGSQLATKARRLAAMAPAVKRKLDAEKLAQQAPSAQQAPAQPEARQGLDGLIAGAVKKANIDE